MATKLTPAAEPTTEDPAAPVEQAPAEPTPGRYRFTGPYPQTYMDRSLLAEPGETYEWPDGPPADGRWIEEK